MTIERTTTPELVASALASIPADCDRDSWLKVGMAVKAEFSNDTGFDLWDSWSQTAPDRYDPKAAQSTWRSIGETGGVGIASLFHMAKQNGWTPPRNGQQPAKPDPVQVAQRQLERQQRTAKEDAERDQRQHHAATEAAAIWAAAAPATVHGYSAGKQVKPSGLRTIDATAARAISASLSPDLSGTLLVIPLFNAAGELRNLQFITADGLKRPVTGGAVKGLYYPIGRPTAGELCIAEGWATAASIHAATGLPVACAVNAGNLMAVALALRSKYPDVRLTVCSDDDCKTPGNPGLTAATEAAKAVGGYLAVPDFGQHRPDGATDFNDLHQIGGADAVKRCIDGAQAVNADGDQAAEPWPEPTPLPDALPPVQPFDPALLPEALRGWVLDIAHRMQCPPDFSAVGALVAISSLIGARAVVRPKAKDDWQVVPNLWGVIIGRPGVMKSPALNEALRPLQRLEAIEREQWKAAHESWEIDCRVTAMAAEANEKKAKTLATKDPQAARALLTPAAAPAEPVARRFLVNDSTVEALGELLMKNPWGTLSYRDELYGLLTSFDRQGQDGARTFYLQAYDGNQPYAFNRIIRGETQIPRVCLSLLGGIQPGRIQEYVRGAVAGGSGDDGLLQRFGLAVWPDVAGDFVHVDRWPDTAAKQAAWAVFERLAQLKPASEEDPAVWRLDDAAQALFVEWRVPFEQELKRGELHPAMESHLAKYRKLIPALALVFALIDTPDSGNVIGERELIRALTWGEYLRTHAERLYAAAVIPETSAARTLLTKIRTGKLTDSDGAIPDSFTPRQVAVKHWAGLDSPEAVRKAAGLLEDYDYLRQEKAQGGAKGGRPSDRFSINPAILKGGAS